MIIAKHSYATVHGTLHIACFLGCYGVSVDYPHKVVLGPPVVGERVWYMEPNGQTYTPKELRS